MPRSDRRAQLVRTAFALIAERGLEGLRFGEIARAAGINNGTLLYYFANKEALIQAVGAYLVEQYSESPWTGTDAPTSSGLCAEQLADPVSVLQHEFADARDRLGDDLGVVYIELLARARRDPAVARLLRDIDANWRSYLISVLERGRREGVFRADMDVDLVATTIMASIRGAGVQALVAGDAASAAPAMDALADRIRAWITLP